MAKHVYDLLSKLFNIRMDWVYAQGIFAPASGRHFPLPQMESDAFRLLLYTIFM
jgi:hypothetical protein